MFVVVWAQVMPWKFRTYVDIMERSGPPPSNTTKASYMSTIPVTKFRCPGTYLGLVSLRCYPRMVCLLWSVALGVSCCCVGPRVAFLRLTVAMCSGWCARCIFVWVGWQVISRPRPAGGRTPDAKSTPPRHRGPAIHSGDHRPVAFDTQVITTHSGFDTLGMRIIEGLLDSFLST